MCSLSFLIPRSISAASGSVAAPAGAAAAGAPPVKINNNLILAIVVAVLCCLPFGIVGIVYAAQVNGKAQGGDIAGAQDYARKAKLWSLWGLGIGLAVCLLYFGLFAAGIMTELRNR